MTDFLDMGSAEQRLEQHRQAVAFAQLYVEAFVLNESGRKLLEHWTQVYAQKRTPVNATINEYVAAEQMRSFIQGIHEQIDFASKHGT